jgi:tryptophan 2,3-dioxygenase
MSDENNDKTQFLLTRYGQINQKHSLHSQVIHRTFYLSLVFLGVLLGAFTQLNSRSNRTILFLFAGLIFASLLLWTRTYHNGRNDFNRQREEIIDELEAMELSFSEIERVGEVFPKDAGREDWEKDSTTNRALQVYYVILSVSPIIGAIVLWLG